MIQAIIDQGIKSPTEHTDIQCKIRYIDQNMDHKVTKHYDKAL